MCGFACGKQGCCGFHASSPFCDCRSGALLEDWRRDCGRDEGPVEGAAAVGLEAGRPYSRSLAGVGGRWDGVSLWREAVVDILREVVGMLGRRWGGDLVWREGVVEVWGWVVLLLVG